MIEEYIQRDWFFVAFASDLQVGDLWMNGRNIVGVIISVVHKDGNTVVELLRRGHVTRVSYKSSSQITIGRKLREVRINVRFTT